MDSAQPQAVRWGVLGTALIAREHVIPALHNARRCELDAIASRSHPMAETIAAEFDIPRAFGSYEEMLADPDIDAVYVPLPNDLHAPWTIRALGARKHVLCEKPLTLTTGEAEAVAAASAEHGVLVMEAFMYRFHPAWDTVRQLLADDAIGRIIDVSIWFGFRSTRPDDYRHTLSTGGGALYDVGCYAVDACRTLLGPDPNDVLATARIGPASGVDMTFSAILDYGDATASFTCSMEQEPQHTIVIHGTGGWISIADPFNCPRDHATTVTIGRGGNHHPHATKVDTLQMAVADQYGLQATAFADAVLGGTPAPLPIEDSIANVRLLERLFTAAGLELPA
ncbi:MAG: Gfo/Idh/MocA family oxidoreductase [Acidimicrobiia bacterium]|nr:Gfo/Idh/MocA family oxidoreductase [Acidimicrobiia bacterium]